MVTVRAIAYSEILSAPNWGELLAEYSAECALPELGAANPQADMYAEMEGSGRFQVFGVYVGDELVGFAAVLVYVVPHYGRRIATVESLFVAKANRTTGAGHGLLNAIEDYARGGGCEAVLYSAPAGGQLERLFTMLKPYRHSNTVFLRAL